MKDVAARIIDERNKAKNIGTLIYFFAIIYVIYTITVGIFNWYILILAVLAAVVLSWLYSYRTTNKLMNEYNLSFSEFEELYRSRNLVTLTTEKEDDEDYEDEDEDDEDDEQDEEENSTFDDIPKTPHNSFELIYVGSGNDLDNPIRFKDKYIPTILLSQEYLRLVYGRNYTFLEQHLLVNNIGEHIDKIMIKTSKGEIIEVYFKLNNWGGTSFTAPE